MLVFNYMRLHGHMQTHLHKLLVCFTHMTNIFLCECNDHVYLIGCPKKMSVELLLDAINVTECNCMMVTYGA